MSEFIETELYLKKHFDPKKSRHYLNGNTFVMHCHHFSVLYTQLAMDCEFLDAKRLLAKSMEDAVYPILTSYYEENCVDELEDKIKIALDLYSTMGLGKMAIQYLGNTSGVAVLCKSHLDEGWLKKFGKYEKPVNYITAGFLEAMFSAVTGKPTGSFTANEVESIVCGAPASKFKVVEN